MHELGYVFADTYLREPEKSGSLCVFRKIFSHIPPPRRDVLRWGEDEAADVCYDRAKARKVLRVSAESARAITRLTLWGEKDGKRICAAHDCRARLRVVC